MLMLIEKSRTSNGEFIVKVGRRTGNLNLPQHTAVLAGANIEHIAQPETWLPQLCGGGSYVLQVYAADNASQRIGGLITVDYSTESMPPKNPDPLATKAPGWAGPIKLIYPPAPTPAEKPTVGPAPVGAVATSMQQPYAATPGVNVTMQGGAPQPTNGYDDRERAMRAREEAAAKQEARAEQLAMEARIRADSDAKMRELELKLRETQLKLETAASRPVEPAKPAFDVLALLTAIGPLFIQWQQAQAQTAAAAAARDERMAKEAREANERWQLQFTAMIEKLTNKPAIDESTKLLIETLRSQGNNNSGGAMYADMMTQMINATGVISKTSITMMQAMAEMSSPEPENPVIGAVREGAKAIAMLAKGAEDNARKVVRQQQGPQALPQAQFTPQQIAAARAQIIAQEDLRRHRVAQAAGAAPSVPVNMQPQPAPVAKPAPTVAAPVVVFSPPAAAEQPSEQPQTITGIDNLEAMIRAKIDPGQIADEFIRLTKIKDPSLDQALAAHGDDPYQLFGERLGEWALANVDYVTELNDVLDAKGLEAGLWEDEPESSEEEAQLVEPSVEPAQA